VVERGGVHGGLLLGVEGLHQVDLDLERALAHGGDVLVHVLALGDEVAGDLEAEHVDPQGAQALLGRAADGDLLHAEDLEWSGHVCCSSL
jgi:hypothetical protein